MAELVLLLLMTLPRTFVSTAVIREDHTING